VNTLRQARHTRLTSAATHRARRWLILPAVLLVALLPGRAWAQEAAARPGSSLAWTEQAPLPHAVFFAGGSRVGRVIVVTGGLGALATPTRHVQAYQPANDTWQTPLQLRVGRFAHAQATLPDGRVLVIGGKVATPGGKGHKGTDAVELLDIGQGTTTPAAPLPKVIGDPQATTLPDGRVLVTGQRTAAVYQPDADAWGPIIRLHQRRGSHAALALNDDHVLVVGGTRTPTLEIVSLTRQRSRALGPRLPRGLDDLALTTRTDGSVWVLGGQRYDNGDTVDHTWRLHRSDAADFTALNQTRPLGIPGGLADHRVVTLGPWAVVVGGETQQAGRDTERKTARLLDRRTGDVFALPDTAWPHDDALAFADERGVLVIGGFGKLGLAHLPAAIPHVERLDLPDHAFDP